MYTRTHNVRETMTGKSPLHIPRIKHVQKESHLKAITEGGALTGGHSVKPSPSAEVSKVRDDLDHAPQVSDGDDTNGTIWIAISLKPPQAGAPARRERTVRKSVDRGHLGHHRNVTARKPKKRTHLSHIQRLRVSAHGVQHEVQPGRTPERRRRTHNLRRPLTTVKPGRDPHTI